MKKKKKRYIFLGIALVLLLAFVLNGLRRLQPILAAMANMRAEAMATDILADAMQAVLEESGIESSDLVTYYYNPSGEVFAYSVDTVTIERLAAQANAKMGEYLAAHEEFILKIPMGQITHHPLLAALGPDIPVRVRAVGNPGVDYARSFEDAGINEINHRIWIEMELMIQVTTPLLTDVRTARMQFTLIDQTMSGKVPTTYLGLERKP